MRRRILDGSSGIINLLQGGLRLEASNVIGLKSPGVPSVVNDALTDLLRDGARQMLALAVEAEVREFLLQHRSHQMIDGDSVWCVTATCRSAPSKPVWVTLKSRHHGSGTGPRRSDSAQRYCRRICGARGLLKNCCHGCI